MPNPRNWKIQHIIKTIIIVEMEILSVEDVRSIMFMGKYSVFL